MGSPGGCRTLDASFCVEALNEAVYLHELTDGFRADRVIDEWIDFSNTERPHSALDGAAPAVAHGGTRPVDRMDKATPLPTSPQAQQRQRDVINRVSAA